MRTRRVSAWATTETRERVGNGRLEATTVEAIREFTHQRPPPNGVGCRRSGGKYLAAFSLLVTTPDDLDRGLDLFECTRICRPRFRLAAGSIVGRSLAPAIDRLIGD